MLLSKTKAIDEKREKSPSYSKDGLKGKKQRSWIVCYLLWYKVGELEEEGGY